MTQFPIEEPEGDKLDETASIESSYESFEDFMDKVKLLKDNGGVIILTDDMYPFESREGQPNFWAVVNTANGIGSYLANNDASKYANIGIAKFKNELSKKWFEEELTNDNIKGYLPTDLAKRIIEDVDAKGEKYSGKRHMHAIPANWIPQNAKEIAVAVKIVNELVNMVFTRTEYRKLADEAKLTAKENIKRMIIEATGYIFEN